jgi:hypothetical protein
VSPATRAERGVLKKKLRAERHERSGHARPKPPPEPVTSSPDPAPDCACQPGQPCLLHYDALRVADREAITRNLGVTRDSRWSGRWTPRA